MGRVRIDDLNLEAPEAWVFRSMGHMILARRDAGSGSLQISTAFRHDLRGVQTPEACSGLAREYVSRAGISEPFDGVQVTEGGSLFGGFSYTVGEEFGRVWYCAVRGQLVLGVYGCSRQKQQPSEVSECESIMRSAHYE